VTNIPTATYVGNAVVVRVKFAERTDRYPTADEVRAEAAVTSEPFTHTYSQLTSGQTAYVGALSYDGSGNESALALASVTAGTLGGDPTIPSGSVAHYVASTGVSTSGATVISWADQSGNARDLTAITGTPTLVSSVVNGRAVVRFSGSDSVLTNPFTPALVAPPGSCTMFVVCAPGISPLNAHCAFSIGNSTAFAYNIGAGHADNHIGGVIETVGWATTSALFTGVRDFDVIVLVHDHDAGTTTYYQNGTSIGTFTSGDTTGTTFGIAIGQRISTEADYWNGDVAEAGMYYSAFDAAAVTSLSDALATKYDVGGAATPDAPTLTYVFSGGDVIVTAASPFADSAKIDASLTGTPSDATVRATTALATLPYSKTFAAPTGDETLYVKAFAYIGANESASTTLAIAPDSTISNAVDAFTPTRIAAGNSFTVPSDKQVIFSLEIDAQGALIVDGDLVHIP
jgi:hypothetical protein